MGNKACLATTGVNPIITVDESNLKIYSECVDVVLRCHTAKSVGL